MPSGGSVALAKECSAVLLGAGACFLRGDKALSPELPELELQDRHSGFSIEGFRFQVLGLGFEGLESRV